MGNYIPNLFMTQPAHLPLLVQQSWDLITLFLKVIHRSSSMSLRAELVLFNMDTWQKTLFF